MKIKVIGKNSSNRIKLLKNVKKVLDQEKINSNFEIEIIDDDKSLKSYNASNTPILIIDEKVISQGKILTEREIKNYIRILA